MLLEYAGEAKLYVPLTRMDLVQKFRGAGEGAAPPLDRLGGVTWERTKSRVKAKMRDMADELLKLYAQRRMAEGFSFSPDSNWQREFEDAFEFTETKDQLSAVQQIKKDMESSIPWIGCCAATSATARRKWPCARRSRRSGDGKQVAVLAPTTVLAFQHFETLQTALRGVPGADRNAEPLPRPRKRSSRCSRRLAEGKVDVLIGTHRIFSKDVEFRGSGAADRGRRAALRRSTQGAPEAAEAERGRAHDERHADSAHAAHVAAGHSRYVGDRNAAQGSAGDSHRGGALRSGTDPHRNRTGTGARRAGLFRSQSRGFAFSSARPASRSWCRRRRVGVGHGQMGEAELEKVLLGFMRHEYDVFVCTTIVENGLDIPLANTMIIENAERYGLSELYQLRGRVGRSNRRAYAYLLVPADTELSEVARKRLAALKEFSDLGAGFKIAALDLELRGAGNILGGEQHGHIAAVGFDMYVRLLEETVHELKGEEMPLEVHSTLNLGLDIRIPSEYISDEHQRLRAYKKMADVNTAEDAERILSELADRYGPPPEAVATLLKFSVLKSRAQRLGIEAIDRRQGALNVKFHKESRIDPNRLMNLIAGTQGAQFTPAGVLRLPLDGIQAPSEVLDYLGERLTELA